MVMPLRRSDGAASVSRLESLVGSRGQLLSRDGAFGSPGHKLCEKLFALTLPIAVMLGEEGHECYGHGVGLKHAINRLFGVFVKRRLD